ncbi:hypothetical protein RAS14_19465 [Achromobacter aegrifaciens]|nr:hypothetical protein [Achromobacter aegrifaciens]MDQ1761948.1 hypothetical protein [Achromobacter aegrifaciens]
MRKLLLVLILFAGGLAHELRNPLSCQTITARNDSGAHRQKRES